MSEKQDIKKDDEVKVKKGFFKSRKQLSIYEEEQVQSPLRTIIRTFLTRKLTILGLCVFGFILLCCLLLPFIFPNDKYYVDSTQQNIAPGFSFMNYPPELEGKLVKIGVGNNFAAGVDTDGNVHVWGNAPDELKTPPSNMGKIVDISCGFTHIIALNEDGELFCWTTKRDSIEMKLDIVPDAVKKANIVQIFAGHQLSTVLDDEGNLYVWGNQNIVTIRTRDVAGRVKKIVTNNLTGIALLDDGTVVCLTTKDVAMSRVPESIQGRAIDVATTDKASAALTSDGRVTVWGALDYDIYDIPEKIQGHVVSLEAGRGHFTVLLDDGTVESWGWNKFRQTNSPSLSGIVYVEAGYFQNYAIDSDGKIHSWGLSGYLMGTDDKGRDVFTRLLAAGRISMSVGAIAVVIATIIGIIIGSISGYFGGKVDLLLMRFSEIWGSIPFLPTAIILSYFLAGTVGEIERVLIIMAILGILSWPSMARLCRAQMLSARENEYVTAARAIGTKTSKVIFRHIFPNILTAVAVSVALNLAGSMLQESSLSFLGLGIVDPTPTWGNMLTGCQNANVIRNYWWRWVFPSLALGLSVLSLNIVGDGLREAIDPRSAGR